MTEPKYAVYPGTVTSRTDGQTHYVDASRLMMLYGVTPEQCLVIYDMYYENRAYRGLIERASKLIALYPQYSGNYTLPTC